jgi:nicotinamide riboside kinase
MGLLVADRASRSWQADYARDACENERRARFQQIVAPDLGQHNREVFGGLLGLSVAEINLLIEEKVHFMNSSQKCMKWSIGRY